MQKELGFDATVYDVIANTGTLWWQRAILYGLILLSASVCIYCLIRENQKTKNRTQLISDGYPSNRSYFFYSSIFLICTISTYLYSKGYHIYYFDNFTWIFFSSAIVGAIIRVLLFSKIHLQENISTNLNVPIKSNYRDRILWNIKAMSVWAALFAVFSIGYEYLIHSKNFAGILLMPIANLAASMEPQQANILLQSYWIFLSFISYIIIRKGLFLRINGDFLPCPYDDCKKSVKVNEMWRCDKCNARQKSHRLIINKCDNCNRRLETVFCEHCHREFTL